MNRRRGWKEGGVRKKGTVWYIRISHNGRRREIRTKAKTRSEAIEILNARLGQLNAGLYDIDAARTRIAELYEDLQRDYTINGRQVKDLSKRWNHLEPIFGGDLARFITTSRLSTYIDARLKRAPLARPSKKSWRVWGGCFASGFRAAKSARCLTSLQSPLTMPGKDSWNTKHLRPYVAPSPSIFAHSLPWHIGPAGVGRSCFVSNGAKLIWLPGKRA
jgi:hypothetical protein